MNLYRAVREGCTEEVAVAERIIQKSNIPISVCCCRTLPLPLQVVEPVFPPLELAQLFLFVWVFFFFF